MGKLNCGTFELYYEDSGGSGEPVALIHGSWGDHHQWDAVATQIAPSFRVISYDRRGHGASSAPGHSLALADQVSDLSALLSVIGRGPLHLVATGVGASIALQLALLRPDQVRSVNIHEPPLLGLLSTDPQAAEALAGFRALEARIGGRLRAGDPLGAAQAYANGVSAEPGGWAELPPPAQASFTASAAAATKESADPAAQNLELSRFASYRDPIVLTGGTRSAPVFGVINDQVGGAFYGALRYAFDGAGHFPHLTHPEAFVRVVGEFCRYASRQAK